MSERTGSWQAEVVSRIDELRGRLSAVEAANRPLRIEERRAIQAAVTKHLEVAESAIGTTGSPRTWWTGSTLTKGWEGVHLAELALLNIERRREVRARLAYLLSWIRNAVDNREWREHHEVILTEQIETKAKFDRVQVRQALVDVIAANANRYANLRTFRNILILATGLLALLVITVCVWHAFEPGFLTLCPEKSKTCLGAPPRSEVALVALIGAIGGSLALTLGLANTNAAPSRYDPKRWQVFLKPVTGAVTAVLGIMFVQAGFIVPPVGTTGYALLAYAVVFGFSQQLFTRLVDRRADELTTPAVKKQAPKGG